MVQLEKENKIRAKREQPKLKVKELVLDYHDLINAIKHKILILIETNTYPVEDQNLLI